MTTKAQILFRHNLVIAIATLLVATPAIAEKPSKAGEKHKHKPHHENRDDYRRNDDKHESRHDKHESRYENERYFNDQHRTVIHKYYDDEYRYGRCPPGLAKKNNGCQPPGQAKRWVIGRPLPRDLIFYDLPDTIVRQIGYPPAGYRFVRVASDILMIAIGTGLVVDAMSDLSGMP